MMTISCKKKRNVMWISIKNDTKYTIDCKFYPTKTANGFTLISEIDTLTGQDEIYSSGNINQKPTDLLQSAYDSIVVIISSLNKDLLFKKDVVKNYKLNPYTDIDSWGFEKLIEDFPTSFSQNETEIYNYYFPINIDNLKE
jgi:hypothetical protein